MNDMNDMNAFERQVAGEVVQAVGPPRPVDDLAMFNHVITATQSPKWRFQSMFSATKFVVAGVIVALFGGFLLSGVLTQPSDDRPPVVGASASATTHAEPTDAPTSEPEPTSEVDDNTATTPDFLPGVDLELRDVGPGIYQVLSDGPHNLTQNVWDIAITSDGEAWVEKHRVVYRPRQYRDDKIRHDYDDSRVLRLGEPGAMRPFADGGWPQRYDIGLDPQGDVRVSGNSAFGRVWRDGAWQMRDRTCVGDPMFDGSCWRPNWYGEGIMLMDTADFSERLFTHEDLGLEPDAGFGYGFKRDDDGIVWTDTSDTIRSVDGEPDTMFTGLASYDGERWTTVETDDPVPGYVGDLKVAPDGSVWVALRVRDDGGLTVLKWDGATWDTYGPVDDHRSVGGSSAIHFAPDGTVWFGATLFYDGSDLRQVALPTALTDGELRVGPHALGPDGSVWAVLIDMRDPKSLGCEVEPDVCKGVASLYVITPEAVAATE